MSEPRLSERFARFLLEFHRSPLEYPKVGAAGAPLPAELPLLLERLGRGPVADPFAAEARSVGADGQALYRAALFFVKQTLFSEGADAYRTLGLAPDASIAEIRERYRLLVRIFHPDRLEDPGDWHERFASRLNEAYNVLKHPASRAALDTRLATAAAALERSGAVRRRHARAPLRLAAGQSPPRGGRWGKRPPRAVIWGLVLAIVGAVLFMGRRESVPHLAARPSPRVLAAVPAQPDGSGERMPSAADPIARHAALDGEGLLETKIAPSLQRSASGRGDEHGLRRFDMEAESPVQPALAAGAASHTGDTAFSALAPDDLPADPHDLTHQHATDGARHASLAGSGLSQEPYLPVAPALRDPGSREHQPGDMAVTNHGATDEGLPEEEAVQQTARLEADRRPLSEVGEPLVFAPTPRDPRRGTLQPQNTRVAPPGHARAARGVPERKPDRSRTEAVAPIHVAAAKAGWTESVPRPRGRASDVGIASPLREVSPTGETVGERPTAGERDERPEGQPFRHDMAAPGTVRPLFQRPAQSDGMRQGDRDHGHLEGSSKVSPPSAKRAGSSRPVRRTAQGGAAEKARHAELPPAAAKGPVQPAPALALRPDDPRVVELITSFLQSYREGDLERFIGLFSDQVYSNSGIGRQPLMAEYRKFFGSTRHRQLTLRDLQWQGDAQQLRLWWNIHLSVQPRARWRWPQEHDGKLALTVVPDGESARIAAFYYSLDGTP